RANHVAKPAIARNHAEHLPLSRTYRGCRSGNLIRPRAGAVHEGCGLIGNSRSLHFKQMLARECHSLDLRFVMDGCSQSLRSFDCSACQQRRIDTLFGKEVNAWMLGETRFLLRQLRRTQSRRVEALGFARHIHRAVRFKIALQPRTEFQLFNKRWIKCSTRLREFAHRSSQIGICSYQHPGSRAGRLTSRLSAIKDSNSRAGLAQLNSDRQPDDARAGDDYIGGVHSRIVNRKPCQEPWRAAAAGTVCACCAPAWESPTS